MTTHTLNAPHFTDAAKGREYLESLRRPNGPVCSHCGSVEGAYALEGISFAPNTGAPAQFQTVGLRYAVH